MPLCLSPGWNQIQFNLADFVRRAYGTNYVETVRIQMHANVLLRRIFFSDRLYPEEEKPPEYRLFKTMKEPVKKFSALKGNKQVTKGMQQMREEPVARPVTPVTTDNEGEPDVDEIENDLKGVKFEEETENVETVTDTDRPTEEEEVLALVDDSPAVEEIYSQEE